MIYCKYIKNAPDENSRQFSLGSISIYCVSSGIWQSPNDIAGKSEDERRNYVFDADLLQLNLGQTIFRNG